MSRQPAAFQRSTLLLLVAVLLLLKFVGQPWQQSQQAKREQIELLSMQLAKAIRVKNLPETALTQQQTLTELRETTEARFLLFRNDADFRLRAQQQLEAQFKQHQVRLGVFEWLTAQDEAAGYLRTYRARVTLEGGLANTMQALLAGQQQLQGLQLLETTFFPAQRGAGYQGRLVILLQIAAINQQEAG